MPSPSPLGYRNKIELTFGRHPSGLPLLGYHPPGEARAVVDIAACLLADPPMGRVVSVARAFFLEGPGAEDPALPPAGGGREPLRLIVRRSRSEGAMLAALRGEDGPFPTAPAFALRLMSEVPEVVGVARLLVRAGRRGGTRLVPVAGRPFLRERVGGISFEVPAASFFQVSTGGAEALLQEVLRAALPVHGSRVLELYGGMGVLGLALARAGAAVVVCEADREAVAAGRRAAVAAGLPVRFLQGDVLSGIAGAEAPDLVLADPPRTGFAPGVARAIAASRPRRIVLVSCDPATLARDLAALHAEGYTVEGVVPLDLFPQTPHVETVTRLVLAGG